MLITFLSLVKIGKIGGSIPIPNKDKIGHFIFYFGFVILWILFFETKKANTKFRVYIVFIAIIYGILMEFFQAVLTTNRTPDVIDVLANSVGAFSGFLFFLKSKSFFYTKISR